MKFADLPIHTVIQRGSSRYIVVGQNPKTGWTSFLILTGESFGAGVTNRFWKEREFTIVAQVV